MFNNIRELLDARIAKYGDLPFLFSESDDRVWTYKEFGQVVYQTAELLRLRGVGKGDVVSLLMPNSAEFIIAYFACWQIGALAGPVNSLLKPEEIEWVVGNSASKLMLVSEPHAPEDGQPKSSALTRYGVPFVNLHPDTDDAKARASARGKHTSIHIADLSLDDDAIIIYTSGTTGKPKGCLLTHGNIIANARQIAEWMGFGPKDRLLTVMPLFHMNAVSVTTMSALYAGGSTVVSPKFSASRFWDIIEKYKITSFGSVATMLSMLLAGASSDHKYPKPESLRFAMCGSAPVPPEVLRKFEEAFGVLVIEGYGLSESTCRSTFNPPNVNRRPGSCGLPIGNEMRVVDDDGNDVPDGELGELVLRGPNIFRGYFKNPQATAEAFRGGWFHTGDIGYRDADGFYYIADRKSDMIIRGGENIYPREIDDLLYKHPAVEHAAAVGVPDELYGEEVAAFIVLKPGYTSDVQKPSRQQGRNSQDPAQTIEITASDIIAYCREHLADYKCPKVVHFVDEIPKGPTGKLLKRELSKLPNAS